jgi:hydroxyacylglutathione hydrolase
MPGGAPCPPRALTEVAPGVHVATAARYSTTSTVVVAADGTCLVVDPALTPQEVGGLAVVVRERGWLTHGAFATHPHWDHVLWTEDLGDVPRWATPACATTADREHATLLQAAADDGAPGHDARIMGRLTPWADPVLPWSREVVVVPYTAHAPGSAALVVTDVGVLLAGDVLSDVEVPLLDLTAADPVADHLRALDGLETTARQYRVRVLVPGHGHVTDAAGLRRRVAADRAYLAAIRDGRTPDDPRLSDAWVRSEHQGQLDALARR